MADRSFAFDYDGLFRQCADSVYRICRAVLGTDEDAQDATQDVFLKLLKSPPKRHVDNLRGWLHTSARTTAIDHLRQMRRAAPLEEDDEQPSQAATPEEIVLDDELRREVLRYLQLLSPNQRRVVELRSEGVPAKEVAALLGRNVNWVNQNYLRGLQRIRAALGGRWPEPEGAR